MNINEFTDEDLQAYLEELEKEKQDIKMTIKLKYEDMMKQQQYQLLKKNQLLKKKNKDRCGCPIEHRKIIS
jgi:hypothetical protein